MRNSFLLISGCLLLLAVFGCDDHKCPTEPEPTPGEHLFYIAPQVGNLIKVLSVEQGKFVDSFSVDSVSDTLTMAIHLIGNDSLMAVTTGGKTFILDLKLKEVIDSFEKGSLVFSRDSRYYLTLGDRNIYTYPGHSLIFDQVNGTLPLFSSDSRYHTIVDWTTPEGGSLGTELTIYDIANDSVFKGLDHIPGIYGYWNYTSDRHQKVFFGALGSMVDFVAAADFGADSIRVLKRFFNSYTVYGLPVVSPDEKFLFIWSITSEFWGGVPDEYIHVYDAVTEDSLTSIQFMDMYQVGNLIITYDSKYLLARPFNEFKNVTNICLIDAVNFSLIGVYDCGFLPFSVSTKYGAKNKGV